MNWIEKQDNVIVKGTLWSVEGFYPDAQDIDRILKMNPNAHIAKEGCRLMIFRDGEFEASGPFFTSEEILWTTPRQQEQIMASRKGSTKLYCCGYHLHRGKVFRLKEDKEIWAPFREDLERAYPDCTIEEVNYADQASKNAYDVKKLIEEKGL